jgi:hypothetical protein
MNEIILEKLSILLNEYPDYITEDMINLVNQDNLLSNEETVRIIIAELFDMYDNRDVYNNYFKYMFKELNINDYKDNLFLKNIKLDDINYKNWSIKNICYKPYELFVYDDLSIINKCVIPQIGFFKCTYNYPAIYESNRIWMLITPNEINTIASSINSSFGNVLTYGLGIGYFAYMAHLKDNVSSITIVESNIEVIELFKKFILPQFNYPDKINIIKCDALEYAKKKIKYDFVFVDIWHDPSDGINLYKQFKLYERCDTIYNYWIEKTMKYYLNED